MRTKGGGRSGSGWDAASTSPGAPGPGTGTSRMGKSGSPVSRWNTNVWPVFVTWATAGMRRPSRSISTRLGGAGRSRSQTSWRTVW